MSKFDDNADKKCKIILKTKDKVASFELCRGVPYAFAQLIGVKIYKMVKQYNGTLTCNIAYVKQ